jgi:predicted N-acetyltransferase YhbS
MQSLLDIRVMTAADLPAVLKIQAACYTGVTPESQESLQAKLSASRSTCLIASVDGHSVGYLISLPWDFSRPPTLNALTCELPPSPTCLHLHDLAVMPAARASGAGRALVEAFLRRLKKSDLGRASLVAVQNSAAYWQRYGFRPVPSSALLNASLATYGDDVAYMELTA